MAFEHKNNSGSIFENERKHQSNSPDWTGSAKIDGVEYRLAGWWKEGRNGQYMSMAFTKLSDMPDRRSEEAPKPPTRRSGVVPGDRSTYGMSNYKSEYKQGPKSSPQDDFSDDDIPF